MTARLRCGPRLDDASAKREEAYGNCAERRERAAVAVKAVRRRQEQGQRLCVHDDVSPPAVSIGAVRLGMNQLACAVRGAEDHDRFRTEQTDAG